MEGMMNQLRELFYDRRSCRRYTEEKISEEQIRTILEAALLAPTGRTKRSCRFLVVDDKEMLGKLALAKAHGSNMIKDASHAIVVMGDTKTTNIWIEDASIATTFIQLMAEELGLGSCWVQIRKRNQDEEKTVSSGVYLKELLGLPEHLEVLSLVALGYKGEDTKRREEDSLDWTQTADWKNFREGNHEL
jgi:nitroreductase